MTTSSTNRLLKKFRDVDRRTDVRAVTDREVPAWMKTLTSERYNSPKLTAQFLKYHGKQLFVSHPLSASYERICS